MTNPRETHIIDIINPTLTLCERDIKTLRKQEKAVKYPDHPADCPQCLITYHEDQEQYCNTEYTQEEKEDASHHCQPNRDPCNCETCTELRNQRRRPGRPAKGEAARDQVKPVRWTAEQWAEVEAVANLLGMNPSAFIRSAVLSQARSIIAMRTPQNNTPGKLTEAIDSALAAARARRK